MPGLKQRTLKRVRDGYIRKRVFLTELRKTIAKIKRGKREVGWEGTVECPDFNATCRQDCSKCKYGKKVIEYVDYSKEDVLKALDSKGKE